MQNTLITSSIVAALAFVGFNTGIGIEKTTSAVLSEAPHVSMTLNELVYLDGRFGQSFDVLGGPINANWSAEVVRGDGQLCSGGGIAPYEGRNKLKFFTPDQWTGDDCPPLRIGDIGRAVWEYKTENGLVVRLSGEIEITENQ